jgi:hypothetical protein
MFQVQNYLMVVDEIRYYGASHLKLSAVQSAWNQNKPYFARSSKLTELKKNSQNDIT